MRASIPVAALFLACLLGAYAVFAPGLSGPFLLDDHVHIPKLAGDDGDVDTAFEVLRLIFSQDSLFGRQLSYASLLIDDNRFPTEPAGFKRTNVLLHLLNAVLVFALVLNLARTILPEASRNRAAWAALAAMALWVVHPLHLSPTMMVIQRMTLLAGTFTLLALIAYLHGRRVAAERPLRGYAWMVVVFGLCVVLGIFSKQPAILTAAYVLVLEATLLAWRGPPRPPQWRLYAAVFLIAPLLAVVGFYVLNLGQMGQYFGIRDFDMAERAMTQVRVLMQYLRVVIAPSLSGSGPYHDDFEVSRGLLEPLSTLGAIVAIVALLGLAVAVRRRWPLLSFALLWFFAGHLLESTVLPLEIYFEHRNYLPMLGFFIAIALGTVSAPGLPRRALAAGIIGFVALTAAVTHASARVWGNSELIALTWAAEHPRSRRAQLDAMARSARLADTASLQALLAKAITNEPDYAAWPLWRFMEERCNPRFRGALGGDLDALLATIPSARFEYLSLDVLHKASASEMKGRCELSDEQLLEIIDRYLQNPRFAQLDIAQAKLHQARAAIYRRNGDLNGTIIALDAAYAAKPIFFFRLHQASLLASAGLFDEAESYMQLAQNAPPLFPGEQLLKTLKTPEVRAYIDRLLALHEKAAAGAKEASPND